MEKTPQLSDQVREHSEGEMVRRKKCQRCGRPVVSTGSTLLDLAISGGCFRGGGIPTGILVEIFGPPSCGKTVMLCEIAGAVQRLGGDILFYDPEARLNEQFAKMFGLNVESITYSRPNTVPEVFEPIRTWEPPNPKAVNAVFADSLAALSTNQEMEDEDKMGMRRAKEFSEQLRKTCRVLSNNNLLMVCSNQVREKIDAQQFEQKWHTPGGQAIPFYASLRLRCKNPQKITKTKKLASGVEVKRIVGVETLIEVEKSSVWQPFHSAVVPIVFDYGIDDIRANLQYLKDNLKQPTYVLGGERISNSLDHAIRIVEDDRLQNKLRNEVIDLWTEIEEKFVQPRRPKDR